MKQSNESIKIERFDIILRLTNTIRIINRYSTNKNTYVKKYVLIFIYLLQKFNYLQLE